MTLPIFKSHYSIGKSILTLKPSSKVEEGGSDSIIDIVQDAGLKEVVLVEDTMHGFLEAKRNCENAGIKLIFGIRVNVCESYESEKGRIDSHKVIFFAKNDEGVKSLYKIYSCIHCDHDSKISESDLKKIWDKDNLLMVIPFYDSFIYQNNFNYDANFIFDASFFDATFFIESNGLPFDKILENEVLRFAEDKSVKNQFKVQKVKSIYYRNKSDFKAFQTYKMITNRAFGRPPSIHDTRLENCGSEEFCMESWLEL